MGSCPTRRGDTTTAQRLPAGSGCATEPSGQAAAFRGCRAASLNLDRSNIRIAVPSAPGCRQTVIVAVHYRAPGWLTRNVFNRAVAFMTRRGVSILGSRVLAVRGRSSGAWRTTPVNLLEHDGRRYLVSARGHGQWVRNLRAAGT